MDKHGRADKQLTLEMVRVQGNLEFCELAPETQDLAKLKYRPDIYRKIWVFSQQLATYLFILATARGVQVKMCKCCVLLLRRTCQYLNPTEDSP
ncbi:hypothetical protein RRG08_009878 [Elysia crispata]|uniref:Uncharacterized protein n=1 Tax=Elysia crispata TaxID=231223 RepID=A0AAE0Z4H1_9GAST|nr:hypothetical protein RRG08_009878 [Elysia crispata]